MKKIINGKKYDTETATHVGEFWNGLSRSDFNHCYEDLYKKKTGEFFLYGKGGPLSKYSMSVGTGTASGEEIIPLTEDEAKKWAEEHLDADAYEALFGEVEE